MLGRNPAEESLPRFGSVVAFEMSRELDVGQKSVWLDTNPSGVSRGACNALPPPNTPPPTAATIATSHCELVERNARCGAFLWTTIVQVAHGLTTASVPADTALTRTLALPSTPEERRRRASQASLEDESK